MERVICDLKIKLVDDGENLGSEVDLNTNIESFTDWIAVFSHIAEAFQLNTVTAEIAKLGIDFYLDNPEVFQS